MMKLNLSSIAPLKLTSLHNFVSDGPLGEKRNVLKKIKSYMPYT